MPKLRILLCIVACLLGFPALAQAETTACDLLTKADVESIIGMQVTEAKVESLNLCAGFCETATGTRCIYVGTLSGAQHVVSFSMELPPFIKSDMIGLERAIMKDDTSAQTAEMQVFGWPAFWTFNPNGYAYLHILDGDEVHFLIWQNGGARNDVALQQAQSMAARVRDRYIASHEASR